MANECLQKAHEWTDSHDDWQMKVAFLCESASWAMTIGNTSLALSTLREIENATGGRERFVIHAGLMAKLRVLRAVHEYGSDEALSIAAERVRFFRDRVPFYHLDAIAALAWVEKLRQGTYSARTVEELKLFTSLGAHGRRALLQAQGFLN